MSGRIWALALLRHMTSLGYEVTIGDISGSDAEPDYRGVSPEAAWNAVKSQEEAHAVFTKDGCRREWAHLMQPGPLSCAPDESVVNYAPSNEDCSAGEIDKWWATMDNPLT